jgi:DNA-binding NtrC family response regulator
MKAGASEYVIKGDKGLIEQLKVRIHQALAHARLTTKSRKMEAKLLKQHQAYTLVGSSTSMLKLKRSLIPLRGTTASVVITGESGTGKELVARALNVQEEDSAERPFQAINCAAIPENLLESELFGHEKGAFTGAIASKPGKFVQADGGDLFLDEIGELPLAMQAKLLRALQEREVTPVGSNKPVKFEVRVICATNRDLKNEVAEGRFREDLYYRIATIELTIPPLRDRSEDIRELVTHFLKKCDCPHLKLSRDAMAAARKHRWPGNIRALHNSLERACIMVSGSGRIVIEKTDLFLPEACASKSDQELVPTHLIPTSIGQLSRDQYEELIHWAERTYFTSALKQVDQSRTQLAEKMGVSRSFVQERLKAVGMVRAERKIPEASTCAIN